MKVDTLQTPLSEVLLRNGEGATEQTPGSKEGTYFKDGKYSLTSNCGLYLTRSLGDSYACLCLRSTTLGFIHLLLE